jgi:hypothetical protein
VKRATKTRCQPRGPSPAKRAGQARSERVREATARHTAVVRVFARIDKAGLLTGPVAEAEVIRTLERLAAGCGHAPDDDEGRAILHTVEHSEAYLMWCRRYPQRVRQAIEDAQMENAPQRHTERRLVSIENLGHQIDNAKHTRTGA